MLYIPNPDVLEREPGTGKYIIPGTMIFCDKNGNECELSIYIRISRSQLDMCVGMPGLMCMHFEVNTYQYQPPIPPQQFNGRVYLPLSVRVPYGIRTNDESECEVNRYDYEVCGIPKQGANAQSCISLATGQISRKGLEITGTIFEFLSIPVDQWNRLSHIQLRFTNNCGDRCDLEPIRVVPLSGGRGEFMDRVAEKDLKVYPIPFSDRLTISYAKDWGNQPFFIYTNNGKLVYDGYLKEGANQMTVESMNWPAGVYMLIVQHASRYPQKVLLLKH
jgi:bifunctional DNA-binding transcriptional regulator/antitoxin component of YhaV-PrlF toxin-antitoxin module